MQLISGAAFRKRTRHPLAGVTVLQVLAELGKTPAARAAIEIAEAIVEVGGTPLVAAASGPLVSELQARGGIFIRFPIRSMNPFHPLTALARLVRLVHDEGVDVVHARTRCGAWIASAAARLTRTPLVTSFPSAADVGGAPTSWSNAILARGDRILVEWAASARLAEATWPGTAGKIHVIGPGIDRAAFTVHSVSCARVGALRRSWNSPPDEPVVLFLTGIEPDAACEFLGATARLLRRRGVHGQRLVHVEAGPRLRAATIDPEAETARALPPCPDPAAALVAASVVALPTSGPESLGRYAVEAQAIGTPVIVAEAGSLAEVVLAPPETKDALRTGWRVPCGAPEALAAAIEAGLALGPSARDRLALRARVHVEQNLSVERLRAETLRAFVAARGGPDV